MRIIAGINEWSLAYVTYRSYRFFFSIENFSDSTFNSFNYSIFSQKTFFVLNFCDIITCTYELFQKQGYKNVRSNSM
jgi:hypothetical protein